MPTCAHLPDDLALAVADPKAYADMDALHRTLHADPPRSPVRPGRAARLRALLGGVKFDDIQIDRPPERRLPERPRRADAQVACRAAPPSQGFRSIVGMNAPDHGKYRLLTQGWLAPKNIRKLETDMRALARRHVDRMADSGGEIDFVREIAVHYPLLVVMAILGVPPQDEPMMLRLTQEYFGNADEDLTRGGARTPEEIRAGLKDTIAEVSAYFRRITADRRQTPADDLASVIANARIDGELMPELDSLGYYITIAFAGHDTTSSSVAGGLWALAERPEELAKVKADPGLVPGLVEESIRWTTPVQQFTRVAAHDAEVRGQTVRKGEQVALCFPSGNRDEEVFDDPFAFRVDRNPIRHVAFGYGVHQCLGMHLARMEMAVFWEELLPRLASVELAGAPRRTITNFVGGPKTLPVRFEMA